MRGPGARDGASPGRELDRRQRARGLEVELQAAALHTAGFTVHRHLMVDWLPYPHVLYVCEAR